MRKHTVSSLILCCTLSVCAVSAGAAPQHSEKQAINPPGTTEGLPFSNGILVGNTLYIAGQEGADNGKLREGGIGPETQAALENVRKIVEGAGMKMKDVVSVTVYLADINEFGDMNKVYKTFFPDPKPARATVQVAALVGHARVEIAAVAVKAR